MPGSVMIVAGLPFHHRDPFDRILVAQCQTENLSILSSDQDFDKYEINLDAEIFEVILNEGERLTDKDVRIFPRLECYLVFQQHTTIIPLEILSYHLFCLFF